MRTILALTVLISAVTSAGAAPITLKLGPSAETYTLYGLGDNGAGRGTYANGQGASSFDGITSTFLLSGAITGSSDPAYATGTYRFITTYAGADTPNAGPNAPNSISNAMFPDYFNYSFIDPSTSISVVLTTPSGVKTVDLFSGNNFESGTNFSFSFVNATCSGKPVSPCTQYNVGLTAGAIYSGPTTIFVSFTPAVPTPEPGTAALAVAGLAALGLTWRSRRRRV